MRLKWCWFQKMLDLLLCMPMMLLRARMLVTVGLVTVQHFCQQRKGKGKEISSIIALRQKCRIPPFENPVQEP